MNESIKKIVKKTKVGTVKRVIKFYKVNEKIGLKNGLVTNMDQLIFRENEIECTGEDPKIFIRFNHPICGLKVKLQVESAKEEDIDVYYSYTENQTMTFTEDNCYQIGSTNGEKIVKEIAFFKPVSFIRIDLGNHKGKLKIIEASIIGEKETQANPHDMINKNEYAKLLEKLKKVDVKNMVIVTHALNEAGAPILAYHMATKLKEKGYSVVIISLTDGYLEKKYKEINIPVINLHQNPLKKELEKPIVLDAIVRSLKRKGYTNVLTNTIVSGITVPIFKKYDFEIVSLIHEMYMSIHLYNMKQGGRDINMYADKIIFPDKIVYQDFFKIFKENEKKSIICPQGLYKQKEEISLDYEGIYKKYNIPERAKIILGSGFADYRKGIDLFFAAAQQLIKLEEKEEYHFIWVGKFALEDLKIWYQLQFEKSGIANRFHIIDFIDDKKEYQNLVSCADAFWLTSREDPYPSVMMEAIEYNTPVLAFENSGGVNTFLEEERGVLIPNFDILEMAKKTKEVIYNQKLQKVMLEKGQNFIAEKLNFEKYIQKIENIFKNLNKKKDKVQFADLTAIIPNYNYEEFLPLRLKSVINQTIKPKEIIFLDDVSKDKSIEVAEAILKKAKKEYGIQYKIVKNNENNGCFKQWLKGIKLASYPFLWIAEADDYATPNFVETLMPKFKNEEVVLCYTASNVIDENGRVSDYDYKEYTNDLSKTKWQKDFIEDGVLAVKSYFSQKNIIPNVSSAMIRTSATIGLDKELKNYTAIGDWFAYIYMASKGKIAYTSQCLNGHRRHTKSIIYKTEKQNCFIKEILKIKNYVLENYELNDKEQNKLLLSIENLEYHYPNIRKEKELFDLFNQLVTKAKEKRKKKNILMILPDLTIGGGQTVAIRLANSIKKYYNVFLINTRDYLTDPLMKNMIEEEVTVLKKNQVEDLRIYNQLLKFTCTISFVWWSDKLAFQAFKDENIPLIISMHGCYEMLLHHREIDPFFLDNVEEMLNRANKIIYTAEKNTEIFKKIALENNGKTQKIDNGFLLGNYPKKAKKDLGMQENDFVFGLVARGIKEKGYEEAIKALEIINQRNTKKAHLILVGTGEYIESLKRENKNKYIHFIDKFTVSQEWLGYVELFDVGLLPSYFKSESLPTVIVEYLFLGKPVIATDIAEIKNMLANEKCKAGITVPLKNGKADVNALAEEMERLLLDKKQYLELKGNTKELAERFNMETCVSKYKKVIEEVDQKQ